MPRVSRWVIDLRGYFKDPDGHLWEVVWTDRRASIIRAPFPALAA